MYIMYTLDPILDSVVDKAQSLMLFVQSFTRRAPLKLTT